MSLSLWDTVVTIRDGVGVIGPQDVPASTVADQLEAGSAPAEVARELGLTPRAFIAALAFDALGDDHDPVGPPLVQGAPRRPGLELALSDAALAGLFPEAGRPARLALVAGLFQLFDHWDAGHNAAQRAEDQGESAVSGYWHGIAHRREPDSANATYWFRRVGRHPVSEPVAAAVRPVLEPRPALAARLAPRGLWEPNAFSEYCTSPRGCDEPMARRLQRIEMAVLLDASIPVG